MAFSDEFDTGLEDDGSTIGMTYDDLDHASPGTNIGIDGLELDPSVTDNLDNDPQTWGSGASLGDPSIEDQMALSGVTDPPPSPDSNMTSESGSGHAAPQPGAAKSSGSATGFFAAFSKFGVGLSSLWTGSGTMTTARATPAPGTLKPSNGAAMALAAILVLLVVVMLFGQKEA